jgi:hypothetical protein
VLIVWPELRAHPGRRGLGSGQLGVAEAARLC